MHPVSGIAVYRQPLRKIAKVRLGGFCGVHTYLLKSDSVDLIKCGNRECVNTHGYLTPSRILAPTESYCDPRAHYQQRHRKPSAFGQ